MRLQLASVAMTSPGTSSLEPQTYLGIPSPRDMPGKKVPPTEFKAFSVGFKISTSFHRSSLRPSALSKLRHQ